MNELRQLAERAGRYEGHGLTHEEQPFYGELSLTALLDCALGLRFRATGIDGTLYREEHGWIASDEQGRLSMWVVRLDHAICLQYVLKRGAKPEGTEESIVFGWSDPGDPAAQWAEIVLELSPDGAIGYRHTRETQGRAHPVYANARLLPVQTARSPTEEEPES